MINYYNIKIILNQDIWVKVLVIYISDKYLQKAKNKDVNFIVDIDFFYSCVIILLNIL